MAPCDVSANTICSIRGGDDFKYHRNSARMSPLVKAGLGIDEKSV